jgi:chromosomal replication initiator protein
VYKQSLRKHLEKFFSFSELQHWFDPLDIRPDRGKGSVCIIFPHIFFRRHFMTHVRSAFEQALSSFDGVPRVCYGEIRDDDTAPGDDAGPTDVAYVDIRPFRAAAARAVHADGREDDVPEHPDDTAFLPEQYTFDNFLFNAKNDLPLTAALETADLVAAGTPPLYNPFVLHGPSGSGKSHLLGAMARALQNGGRKTFYGNIMTFPALLETAPGRCPATDGSCIFLDDAQRVSNCADMQDALVALMDSCLSSRTLLALSFDRHPSSCPELGRPLLSRIASGLIAELKRPDLDIRLRYAEKRSAELELALNKEQLLSLASRNADIRGIDGYFARLTAYRSMSTKNGSPASAQEAYAALTLHETDHAGPTPELIIAAAAEHFSVDPEDIIGKRRDRKTASARNTAMFLCRELLNPTLANIGRVFGNRDHTSVLYAVKTVGKRCAADKDTHKLVEELKQKCLNRR